MHYELKKIFRLLTFVISLFFLSLQFEKRLSQAGEILREESRDSTEHHTS